MARYIMSFDEEVNNHINEVLGNLKNLGIKNVSKADALRYIITMNKQSNLLPQRKPRTKPNVKEGVGFYTKR